MGAVKGSCLRRRWADLSCVGKKERKEMILSEEGGERKQEKGGGVSRTESEACRIRNLRGRRHPHQKFSIRASQVKKRKKKESNKSGRKTGILVVKKGRLSVGHVEETKSARILR